MSNSLIPEKPLLVYPSLAKTLGLEESLLFCVLTDEITHLQAHQVRGYDWYQLSLATLLTKLPFWTTRDIQRICGNLREKGILIISTISPELNDNLRFAFNQKAQAQIAQSSTNQQADRANTINPAVAPASLHQFSEPATSSAVSPGLTRGSFLNKNFIAPNWQPDDDTIAQLAQHTIPKHFALEHVPEFVTYWRERGEQNHSWGAKFMQHILRKWRDYEAERFRKEQEAPIRQDWYPNPDAMEILIEKAGIKKEFIEDAIPEFILYWSERGDSHRTWNTKFVQHVRLQWAKFTAAIEHNTDPRPIPSEWQPSQDLYDVLTLANIDIAFAKALIPEFVLYWRDRGILYSSWNTKYLQHVKRMWAQRHTIENTAQPNRSTREISLEEQLTDRSWAN